ncbi:MAG TPA: sterol desaturase family protein, partial [Chitinophagaceae bacterium]
NQQLKCFAVFILILTPIICCLVGFASSLNGIFPWLLFFTGWFTWTFVEYILHRFWNHEKGGDNSIVQKHNHHHTHPTDIYVSATHRSLMLFIDVVLISLSLWVNPYILIIVGIWTGFFWFFMMHFFMHQKWAKKVFPRLVHYHVIHHCKEPDACFGVSTRWWDHLFGTTPRKNKEIPERIITFYYKKEEKATRGSSILSVVDEKLSSANNS